jgi:hypothetical protein
VVQQGEIFFKKKVFSFGRGSCYFPANFNFGLFTSTDCATYREPELVVDNRSEALHRAFDPTLVEVDVCLHLGLLSVDVVAPAPMGVLGLMGAQYF